MLLHINLGEYYQMVFAMAQHHKYSISEIENMMNDSLFWSDIEKSSLVSKEYADIKNKIEKIVDFE